jgi:uncharacterized protein YjbJ (UPF0337 family)
MDKQQGHESHKGSTGTNAWEGVEKSWSEFKVRIQDRWDRLTEQELDQIAGSYDRLLRKLQEKYELTMDQAEYELAEFLSTLNPAT